MGAIGCAALGAAWSWLSFLVIFVIARVGYNSSIVFYDSMLPEVTSEERMDNVSTMGYALGYIGSVIPFAVCLVLVLMHDSFGMSQVTALIISFLLTAIWWVVCSLPLAKRYTQTAFQVGGGKPIGDSFQQLVRTFKDAKAEMNATPGILDNLASKFTINIDAIKLFNVGLQASEGALNVAKDAFLAS